MCDISCKPSDIELASSLVTLAFFQKKKLFEAWTHYSEHLRMFTTSLDHFIQKKYIFYVWNDIG
jgi:hypothetical protein